MTDRSGVAVEPASRYIEADTTFQDALAGDVEKISEIVYETTGGLSVVPSGVQLDGYAEMDLRRLPNIVDRLRWRYDVVFLDTPAGLSEETIAPLRLADETVLVSTPGVASVRNVGNTQELVARVDGTISGLVLTKSGTGDSPGAHSIAEFLGVDLLGHVPEDKAIPTHRTGVDRSSSTPRTAGPPSRTSGSRSGSSTASRTSRGARPPSGRTERPTPQPGARAAA